MSAPHFGQQGVVVRAVTGVETVMVVVVDMALLALPLGASTSSCGLDRYHSGALAVCITAC